MSFNGADPKQIKEIFSCVEDTADFLDGIFEDEDEDDVNPHFLDEEMTTDDGDGDDDDDDDYMERNEQTVDEHQREEEEDRLVLDNFCKPEQIHNPVSYY